MGNDDSRLAANSRLRAAVAASSSPATGATRAEPTLEVLCVRIRDRGYAFLVEAVREVLNVTSAVAVPHTPSYIGGVFNRHGHVTAIFDLGVFVGDAATATGGRHVVIQHGSLDAAIPVSEIVGTVNSPRSELRPPLVSAAAAKGLVLGELTRGDDLFSVIDVAALLDGSRLERETHG